jgi:hypothetical protein
MVDWIFIREQVGKPILQPTLNRWLFPESNNQSKTSALSSLSQIKISTITDQIDKKTISKKNIKDRVVEKSISLSHRVTRNPYK